MAMKEEYNSQVIVVTLMAKILDHTVVIATIQECAKSIVQYRTVMKHGQ